MAFAENDMVHSSRLVLPRSPWLDAAEADVTTKVEPLPGDPRRSSVAGAVAGLLGGWLALALEQGLQDQARLGEYLRVALGSGSVEVAATPGAVWVVIAYVGLAGMVSGAGLGWLMRRLHGFVGRIVFGAVLVPSVWIAVDAFGLLRFAPRLTGFVPFVPCLFGAVAYGICVALARPVAARSPDPWTRPDAPLEDLPTRDVAVRDPAVTDSFLLLRRKVWR